MLLLFINGTISSVKIRSIKDGDWFLFIRTLILFSLEHFLPTSNSLKQGHGLSDQNLAGSITSWYRKEMSKEVDFHKLTDIAIFISIHNEIIILMFNP